MQQPACGAGQTGSLCRVSCSRELPGLTARLDKLCYHHGGASLPTDKPHAFVYFVTIRNAADRAITLLGRKWVVQHADGTQLVVRGTRSWVKRPGSRPASSFPTTATT